MNRRDLIKLSGAVVAGAGVVKGASSGTALSPIAQQKLAIKLNRPKASYVVPGTEAKANKYLQKLTSFFGLSTSQQEDAKAIFASARASRSAIRSDYKTSRKQLRDAVRSNDIAAIERLSSTMGALNSQAYLAGARAQAALVQILTFEQRAKLGLA